MSTTRNDGGGGGVGKSVVEEDNHPLAASPLYETKTLMCKNNCGYYGNPIQYEGYCSICYRKLKQNQQQQHQQQLQQQLPRGAVATSAVDSFNDSSNLLTSSVSFNNGFYADDNKNKNSQIWNEHSNLNKFSSKPDSRRRSTFKIFRRPSSNTTSSPVGASSGSSPSSSLSSTPSGLAIQPSTSLVDTVSKVATQLVDQSLNTLNSSTSSLLSLTSSSTASLTGVSLTGGSFLNEPASLFDFNRSLNRLMSSSLNESSSSSSTTTTLSILIPSTIKTSTASLLPTTNGSSSSSDLNSSTLLNEFEEKFKIYFSQLYHDLQKQMKQFVEKFLHAFYKRPVPMSKDELSAQNTKQSEVVQEFYKKINKYVLTSASIRSYLERLNYIKSLNLANTLASTSLIPHSNNYYHDLNNHHQQYQQTPQEKNLMNLSQQLKSSSNPSEEYGDKLYEAVMIMVESFVNANLYDYVFPSIMSEYEEQDMSLQKRIRGFYWITNDMIGTCVDEHSIFYRDLYEEALNSIVEMDSKRTSYEKMLCITDCSKNIYKAINISSTIALSIAVVNQQQQQQASAPASPAATPTNEEIPSPGGSSTSQSDSKANRKTSTNRGSGKNGLPAAASAASADDYLPAFIYIVLKANPTMLYSNINFVTRFAFEKRILQGEHAYHFCSLNASIAHIENLNAHHLNMSPEEFENYCQGLVDVDSSSNNVLKMLQTNLKVLGELKDKQRLLKQETLKLQTDITIFRQLMQNKFTSCLNNNKENYTQNVPGYVRNTTSTTTAAATSGQEIKNEPQCLLLETLAAQNNKPRLDGETVTDTVTESAAAAAAGTASSQ